MTPKEKAKELVYEFLMYVESDFIDSNSEINNAKQCALISVDEIIKSNPCYEDSDRGGNFQWNDNTYYWQEVKNEINKL